MMEKLEDRRSLWHAQLARAAAGILRASGRVRSLPRRTCSTSRSRARAAMPQSRRRPSTDAGRQPCGRSRCNASPAAMPIRSNQIVVSVTSIESSSKAFNVIAQRVHLKGTVRTHGQRHARAGRGPDDGDVRRVTASVRRRGRRELYPRLSGDGEQRGADRICRRSRASVSGRLRRGAAGDGRRGFRLHARGTARRLYPGRQWRHGARCITPNTISTTMRSPRAAAGGPGSSSSGCPRPEPYSGAFALRGARGLAGALAFGAATLGAAAALVFEASVLGEAFFARCFTVSADRANLARCQ